MITTKIVYVIWKIIGLCPYGLTNWTTVRFSYGGFLYSMLLSSLYVLCYVSAIIDDTDFYGTHNTPMAIIADIVSYTVECCMIITTWITFAFWQRRFRSIQKSYRGIVDTGRKLGIQEIHGKVIKRVSKHALIYNAIWMFLFTLGSIRPPKQYDMFIWIPYNLGHTIHPNFIILYMGVMATIHDQFQSMNNKLREIFELQTTVTHSPLIRCIRFNNYGIEHPTATNPVALLGQLHAEMVNLTRSVIDVLSPALYLAILVHLSQLCSIVYAACVGVRDGKLLKLEFIAMLIPLCFWFSIHVMGIIYEIAIADLTTSEVNRTGNILHEVLVSKPMEVHVRPAAIWSLRMLQEPMTIQLFGVLGMKASLLYTICGSILGYVTMMLQLDELGGRDNDNHTSTLDAMVD